MLLVVYVDFHTAWIGIDQRIVAFGLLLLFTIQTQGCLERLARLLKIKWGDIMAYDQIFVVGMMLLLSSMNLE